MGNEEQIAYWNGDAGRKWAQRDAIMSRMLAPIAEALMDHANVDGAKAAIDVGCGGGSETLMLARRLGPDSRILGVDVSAPLLEVARANAAALNGVGSDIRFLEADAAACDFDGETFDLLFSRFGVMFFSEPVAAFRHLRSAMRPAGRLAFSCWQAMRENPWTTLPLQAALTVLEAPPPPPQPRAPGPFAFAEPDYLQEILRESGWEDVEIAAHTATMRWESAEGFSGAVRELVNTGPVGRLLAEVDAERREQVHHAAEGVLKPYFHNNALVLSGAVWLVTAVNR